MSHQHIISEDQPTEIVAVVETRGKMAADPEVPAVIDFLGMRPRIATMPKSAENCGLLYNIK